MKQYLMAAAAALALSATPALAGDVYMGADLSRTKLDGLSGTASGWNLYAGYRFNESLAVEGGFRRLADKTVRDFGVPVKLKGEAYQVSALGYLPLGTDFALFARLGVNHVEAKADASGFIVRDSEVKMLAGVGFEYQLSKSIALRAEFQRPDSDTDTSSLGLKISF